MRKLPLYVSLLVASAWATPSEAQFFSRKPRTTTPAASAPAASPPTAGAPTAAAPAQRVGELIGAAQADSDERKRVSAVAALRHFDGSNFPEVAVVLADLARSDKSAAVREQAVESLAALRPVSQVAGQALEWSAANDSSWRVRWQAKTSLLRYNLAGYSRTPSQGAPTPQVSTQEPPLLDGPRGYASPSRPASPNRPPSVQLPPRVESPAARTPQASPQAPSSSPSSNPSGSLFGRILPGRKPSPPPTTPGSAQPALAPAAPPTTPTAPPPLLETPPPIVIETPPADFQAPVAPLPPGSPTAGNLTGGKNAAPAQVKGADVTEPTFRPAGQARPGFTTAEPQRQKTVPPAKSNADVEVPLLIPPM